MRNPPLGNNLSQHKKLALRKAAKILASIRGSGPKVRHEEIPKEKYFRVGLPLVFGGEF